MTFGARSRIAGRRPCKSLCSGPTAWCEGICRQVLRMVAHLHQIPDDSQAGAAERTARAQYLGQDGRTYHVLLGEQALLTGISPQVMRAQLEHLLRALDASGLRLGIVPARSHLYVYPGDGFGIHDGIQVEVEGYRGCETITDPDRVALFHRAFGLLQESAVYGQDARALIATPRPDCCPPNCALRAQVKTSRPRSSWGTFRGLSALSGGRSGDFLPRNTASPRKIGKGLRCRSEALPGAKPLVRRMEPACTPGSVT
ncbi:Scr1 family TA system antitoxin-like transcriptional regulator [Kitasatospora sp. NPDC057500]|uniref:Scr1 family TA system antitoxin-like transcriptional regulator n=1 Tax=Kitasatospora sp. NPDC057500 TaxID=3346151 RepID=UPI00369C8DA5